MFSLSLIPYHPFNPNNPTFIACTLQQQQHQIDALWRHISARSGYGGYQIRCWCRRVEGWKPQLDALFVFMLFLAAHMKKAS
ncbi:hypothetical protein QVD17_08805 [Tagetes erecta]|uniref:Uncharacterized protein n=1 Tax=Tagetes erecta TaxID=13708 RepID=A0AAD8P4S2_TARER|nr:hypothetical protein QVD17_08804 [Tagetes erecta]KAK1431972.1 hypothetical protein QVD17_08805 [Tagetes erecta]